MLLGIGYSFGRSAAAAGTRQRGGDRCRGQAVNANFLRRMTLLLGSTVRCRTGAWSGQYTGSRPDELPGLLGTAFPVQLVGTNFAEANASASSPLCSRLHMIWRSRRCNPSARRCRSSAAAWRTRYPGRPGPPGRRTARAPPRRWPAREPNFIEIFITPKHPGVVSGSGARPAASAAGAPAAATRTTCQQRGDRGRHERPDDQGVEQQAQTDRGATWPMMVRSLTAITIMVKANTMPARSRWIRCPHRPDHAGVQARVQSSLRRDTPAGCSPHPPPAG